MLCPINCSVVSESLQAHGLQPSRLLYPWDSPSKDIGVESHFLLQGIFSTQGSNPGLLHCRRILYHLTHQGSPVWFTRPSQLVNLNFGTSRCDLNFTHKEKCLLVQKDTIHDVPAGTVWI